MPNYFNYFTEIEEHFVRLRARNLLLSPLDWSLIETWKKSGIPLPVVLRGIERTFENSQKKGAKAPRTLFYCHPAVVEAFEEYSESRVGGTLDSELEEPGAPERKEVGDYIDSLLREVARVTQSFDDDLAEVPSRVLERLRFLRQQVEIPTVRLQEIDRELNHPGELLTRSLEKKLSQSQRKQIRKQVSDELKAHRRRLGKEMYQRLRDNYQDRRIREHFGLPEFSILEV